MKFGYAWTFGEAPAPEKRTPSLPRPPAGLRNSNWAASPRRACFRLLGRFRIRFGYLERPPAHRDVMHRAPSVRCRPPGPSEVRLALGEAPRVISGLTDRAFRLKRYRG